MEGLIPWLGWILAAAGAIGTLLGTLGKSATGEWKEVAEAREAHNVIMEARVADLESRLAKLEGRYAALESLKVDQIADRVAVRLLEGGVVR